MAKNSKIDNHKSDAKQSSNSNNEKSHSKNTNSSSANNHKNKSPTPQKDEDNKTEENGFINDLDNIEINDEIIEQIVSN